MQPFEPPLQYPNLDPPGGELGPSPVDFVVDEIPAYSPTGEGQHVYAQIRKTNYTTPAMVDLVARAAGVDARDIGYAGMKDRWAVTTQWVSLPQSARPTEEWSLPSGIEVVARSRHANKLRTGHLLGNRFDLGLIGTDRTRLSTLFDRLRLDGLANFYGPQRFGRQQGNLDEALAWLSEGADRRHRNARFYAKFLPSAVQSEVFNRYAAARIALGLDRAIAGEWVRLANAGAGFVVDDVAEATDRLLRRDIVLTGPLPGGRLRPLHSEAAELLAAQLATIGLQGPALERLADLAPGARRDLFAEFGYPSIRVNDDGTIRATFTLPPGSYASQVAREITRLPWIAPFRRRPVVEDDAE